MTRMLGEPLEGTVIALAKMQIRSPADTLAALRTSYDVASIVQLSVCLDTVWTNICTAIIRGNSALRRTLDQPKRDEVQVGDRLFAFTCADVDATQADAFVVSASSGTTIVPGTNISVIYSLAESDFGFWGKPSPPNFPGTPLTRCCWARSFPTAGEVPGFELLATSGLARVADRLPQRYAFPFGMVDVRLQLARIGSLTDLYPSYPEMHWRRPPGGEATVDVAVPAGLALPFAAYCIHAELINRGERFASVTLNLRPGNENALHSTTEIEGFAARLYADEILLSEMEAYFIKQAGVNMSVMTQTIVVPIDGSGAALGIGQSTPISAGAATSVPDRRGLAEAWTKSEGDRARYKDVLFVPAQTSALDAYSWIAMLVRDATAQASDAVVRLVDRYAIDETCLRPIATVAAASTQKRIAILSDSLDPQTHKPDPQFTGALQRLATDLGIKIELHAPKLPLHDRFIALGDRIWHVGHSFNALGRDLSAIIEIRDLRLIAQAFEVLNREFSRSPVVFTP